MIESDEGKKKKKNNISSFLKGIQTLERAVYACFVFPFTKDI